ncbi:MAG: hypothetical protein ABUS49_12295 [Acidobacteriota bacterium]
MKNFILAIWIVCAGAASADEPSERQAIAELVAALNKATTTDHSDGSSALYTADAGPDRNRLSELHRRIARITPAVLSETTPPWLAISSIRFLTPAVALVDVADTQYGSMMPASKIPILIIAKKVGSHWKVAGLRVLELGAPDTR